MEQTPLDEQSKAFLELAKTMDEHSQYALLKLIEMMNARGKDAALPTLEAGAQFLEQARLESLKHTFGSNKGDLLQFPTAGLRTDVKPCSSSFAGMGEAVDRALTTARERAGHIDNASERYFAEMRAAAEEGARETIAIVADWLSENCPDVHAEFLDAFLRTP